MGGVAKTTSDARVHLKDAIAKGHAVRVFERMIEAQGGDPRVVAEPERLVVATATHDVVAQRSGVVTAVDALEIGLSAVVLGAGRTRSDQAVDAAVGITVPIRPGDRVKSGDLLARLYVRRPEDALRVQGRVRDAFVVGDEAPPPAPLVRGRIEAS